MRWKSAGIILGLVALIGSSDVSAQTRNPARDNAPRPQTLALNYTPVQGKITDLLSRNYRQVATACTPSQEGKECDDDDDDPGTCRCSDHLGGKICQCQ